MLLRKTFRCISGILGLALVTCVLSAIAGGGNAYTPLGSKPAGDSLSSDTPPSSGLRVAPLIPDSGALKSDSLFTVGDSAGLKSPADSLVADSLSPDSLGFLSDRRAGNANKDSVASRMRLEKVDIDGPVKFQARDSLLIIRRDTAYMFGESKVDYGDMSLAADRIEMDLKNSNVYAVGALDSVGDVVGSPVFSQNGTDYEASTMRYNFKTEKGFLTDIVTQQGEGYITGGVSKKDKEGNYYLQNGRYTTCDDKECPHFYFQLTKAKVRPGENSVFGPSYMVLAGLPLPIAVPFGYFPFTESYASGIIVPSFGDDYKRGFYLSDGGYYFAINDNIDLALTGEIYTKGSWGLQARSAYVKRYKYNGSFNVSYLKTVDGEKGDPDYSTATNFQVLWNHSQDAKANPNMTLSASVNFTTAGYSRSSVSSYYTPNFTENTKSSTISLNYRFPRSKWSMAATLNVAQRSQDSTLAVSFPNLTVTMSQVYPFKRKKAAGDEKWYEKIRMSYSGQLQNSLTAKQDVFFKKSLIKDWRNAMRHNVPISATFQLFRYINITPSLNLTDRMYTSKVKRSWDAERQREVSDTTYSFYNVWDFQASVSLDTKIYGFFQPLGFLGKKVKMIRHVMTPSISFSGNPDFSGSFFGYYGSYNRPGANGEMMKQKYSYFSNQLYGVPGEGKQASLSYSLANNLEMKLKADNDTAEDRKISLIENLTMSQSYNFAADSLKFSDINTNLLLRLTKNFNLNLQATWDFYTYGINSQGSPVRLNKTRLAAGKGLGRLRQTGTSFSYTFNNDTFRRKKKDDKKKGEQDAGLDDPNQGGGGGMQDDREKDDSPGEFSPDGYLKWEFPWSLSVNYSINYGYGDFDFKKMEYKGRVTQNLSLSGNIRPTKNWNFSFSASYDFNLHKLAYMNCNISRDLHCFAMTASFIPVGPYKSFNFHIAVKSSLLSDFKYDKRSSSSNGVRWY